MNLSRCCRGSVDGKNTSMDRESVENLSAKQRAQKFCLMDRDSVKICREKRKKGSIEMESVEKLSSLKKRSFSRKEKYIKMNATSKLLKQRSNQHIKFSKHLSTYMQSIQDPKHTHTHAHQTSLTNFIFQKQVKIVQ